MISSPGAKCEDYPEFPNQKDPSHSVSPQGSKDCAHTESTSTDSSVSADKRSPSDSLPAGNRSNHYSVTCSGENDDDGTLSCDSESMQNNSSHTDPDPSVQKIPSNSIVECSNGSQECVNSHTVDATTPNSEEVTDKNVESGDDVDSEGQTSDHLQNTNDKNHSTDEYYHLPTNESKDELENIPSEIKHSLQSNGSTLESTNKLTVDQDYNDKDAEKLNEDEDKDEKEMPDNQSHLKTNLDILARSEMLVTYNFVSPFLKTTFKKLRKMWMVLELCRR